jgi:hypothetical protein
MPSGRSFGFRLRSFAPTSAVARQSGGCRTIELLTGGFHGNIGFKSRRA